MVRSFKAREKIQIWTFANSFLYKSYTMFTLDQSTIQMIISVSYTINLIKSLTDGASPLELNTYDRLDKEIQITAK